jgi:hypothetical protein
MFPHVVIDQQFAAILTPHTAGELALLSRSLLDEGCREPLTVWKGTGILLDGHARHRLCVEHNIAFEVVEIDLPDREAAVRWVLERQLGRRNLRPIAASYYRGKLYLSLKRQGARTDLTSRQSDRKWTADALAQRYGVDARTVCRDAAFARDLDRLAGDMGDGFRSSVLSGEARLTRKDIRTLAGMGRQERERFVRDRVLARYQPPPTPLPDPGDKLLARLADLWRVADEETRRRFLSMPEVAAAFDDATC